jgi:hypothetical protein
VVRATITALATAFVAIAAPASAQAAFSITDFTASPASAPAGSHPDSSVSMSFGGGPTDDVKDIIQHFPAGVIPNPEALPKCTQAQLAADLCPAASRLGPTSLTAEQDLLPGVPTTVNGDVYNIEVDPPYVGGLGFVVRPAPGVHSSLAAPFTVRTARHDITTSLPDTKADIYSQPTVPTERDNGLTGVSVNVPRDLDLLGLGSVPIKVTNIQYSLNGIAASTGNPYLTTTTACIQGYPELEATSWDDPGTRVSRFGNVLTSTDCDDDHVPFDPLPFDVTPETTRTDTPSGYDISLNVPSGELPRHQSYLRKAVITLPPGTALSPPAAQGLEGCTDAQLGIGSNAPPTCPAASDIGDVTVVSKNVPNPLHGDFYLGQPTQGETFRSFIAFPIVDGLWVKLAGTSVPDPQTGQVTTTFDDLPMLPFEKFTISLEGGDRAVLVNPPDCGTHTLTSALTPWSGATDFPADKDKHPEGSFSTSYDGQGAPCPSSLPFDPSGTVSTSPTQGGASSTMSMTLSNPDRHQLLRTLRASLPPGLVGRLPGIPLCSVAAAAAGTCGAESRIGGITASVGAGPSPLSLPGSVYLAKQLQAGDPASLSIVVPAKVGPFDFGNVVTRARVVVRRDVGLDVVLVDDLPQIVGGIPIRLRSVGATIDRRDFTLNPTSCAQLQFGSSFTSFAGGSKSSSSPYQATGCDALPFSPKLRFTAGGETKVNGHPSLKAVVTQSPGQANIARSRVVLPDVIRPELLALQRPGGLCPEAALATRTCPATSRVGTASVTTPLLPEPLTGPVYIVQTAASILPKLTVFLDGLVSIQLDAQNEIQHVSIVNRFDSLPDVPFTRFELTINGGRNGILKNFRNLCGEEAKAQVSFTAHSGKTFNDTPEIDAPRCESASSAPKVSVMLARVDSGSPVLTLRARRSAGGPKLRTLSLTLPGALRVNPARARSGVLVKASRKLGRSKWTLSPKGVLKLRRLPKKGVASITAVLRRGVLRPSAALRSPAGARKRKRLAFKVRVVDAGGHRFRITRRLRVH